MTPPEVDEILGGDNELTKALLAYGGSYSYNHYFSGEIVVKFDDGQRFTTKDRNSAIKGAKPIKSILEEENEKIRN